MRLHLILEAANLKISSHVKSSNDYKDHPNQHKNSHKLCDQTGHNVVNLMESQWKLRQQWDHKLPMAEQILASEINKLKKSRTMRITVWNLSKKVNHLSKVI